MYTVMRPNGTTYEVKDTMKIDGDIVRYYRITYRRVSATEWHVINGKSYHTINSNYLTQKLENEYQNKVVKCL